MAAEQQSAAKPGGTRFAVTCGLLRQYMKEQGAAMRLAPAMAITLAPQPEKAEEGTTMLELFPQEAGTLKKDLAGTTKEEPAERRAPLTIFYGGRMVVFDDFPAEKAEELMKAAGSCSVAAGQPCLPGTNEHASYVCFPVTRVLKTNVH